MLASRAQFIRHSALIAKIMAGIFAGLLIPLSSVMALDLDVRSSKSSRLDFSMQLERSSIEIKNPLSSDELELTRIGIVSIEVPPSGLQFGLLLGYAYADFSDNGVNESIDMDGYYLGISARAYPVETNQMAVLLSGHYLYQSIDGKDDLAKASLSWDEFYASAIVEFRMQNLGVLYAGGAVGQIDARYRYRGSTNVSVDIENENQQGLIAGFTYFMNPYESVGVSFHSGITDGLQLHFRKIF